MQDVGKIPIEETATQPSAAFANKASIGRPSCRAAS